MDKRERQKYAPVNEKYEKIPLFCKISLIITVASILIYIIACINADFADFFNVRIGSITRVIFAKISNIVPFSLAELIILTVPVSLFLLLWYFLKFRCKTLRSSAVSCLCVLSVAGLLLSSFIINFGTGYRGNTLDKKLGIDREKISAEELYDSTVYLVEKVNEKKRLVNYGDDGFSIMPYSFDTMNEKLLDAYASFSEKHSFINSYSTLLKPIASSEAMSYTHITGVYTFFTGEANVNVNFPTYSMLYTAAHELAHQRGIAREDEANMIAFLVLLESDDPYIEYCAYLNMYEYVSSALYRADKELYRDAVSGLDAAVRKEQIAFNKFFDKYENSQASVVTGAINDAYLQTQGTEGKKSYGMVVDLTVAYFKSLDIIE